MSKKLYVGNLNYATTEDTLKNVFASYGEIVSAVVIKDRDTQQSKGFGFVELADDSAADKAIAELNGREIDGRRVRVNVAEERQNRGPRNFNRGGFRGDFRRGPREGGFPPANDNSY
ncbi:MAG: RNA-binding protein [Treponema sp.]|nr:RNA-binding protein [Treponema sp.]MBR4386242.1 RNA-binding protein [Treponema sp.]